MHISRRNLVLGGGALVGFAATGRAQGLIPTSEQVLGPFYPLVRPRDSDADLTRLRGRPGLARGKAINVVGRIVDRRGNPVRGARVELWQANAGGRYDHPGDSASKIPVDPNFQGFAALVSDRDGHFRFRTVKPGAYAIPGGQVRTPHIHFDIRGQAERLTTQMYFPGEPLNERDIILRTADPRASVISRSVAALSGDPGTATFAWDVVLAVG
jgi:protocatechuate 3,4-dioxygenase beta subunit